MTTVPRRNAHATPHDAQNVGRVACYLISAVAFGASVALLAYLVRSVIADAKTPPLVAELVALFFVSGFLGTWAGALADSGTIILPHFVAKPLTAGSTTGGYEFALGTLGDALSGGIIALAASTLIRGVLVPSVEDLKADNALALVTIGVLSGLAWKQLVIGLRGWMGSQVANLGKKTEELELRLAEKDRQILDLRVDDLYGKAAAAMRDSQFPEALGFLDNALARPGLALDRQLLLKCLKAEILSNMETPDHQKEARDIVEEVVDTGDKEFKDLPVKRAGYRISRSIVACNINPDDPRVQSDLEEAMKLYPGIVGSIAAKANGEFRALHEKPWFKELIGYTDNGEGLGK